MASIITAFNYNVTMNLVLNNGKEIQMIPESIKSVAIDNNYDKYTMPIIFVGLRLSNDMYDTMVANMQSATIIFSIYKYDKNSTNKMDKVYIRDRFIYVMPSDPNYNRKLEETSTDPDQTITGSNYKEGYITLLKADILNKNKVLNNAILKNTSLLSIIHLYTKHMNMVIEPIKDKKIDMLIIPPMESILKLIKYLDYYIGIYEGGYRWYRDLNCTYLLSNQGNSVPSKDSTFDSMIIRVLDNSEDYGQVNSIEINRDKRTYVLNVSGDNTNIDIDKFKSLSYDSIIGIDTEGNYITSDLNIPKNIYSEDKKMVRRIYDGKTDELYGMKKRIENSSVILNITKTEMDASLLTPNKEYQVKNFNSYSQYDGKYILSYKKEILIQQDNNFIGDVMFGLRKVI